MDERRTDLDDKSINQILISAITAHQRGDHVEAEKQYTKVLEAAPDNPDANHNYGILLASLRRTDAALIRLDIAVQKKPGSINYQFSLIKMLLDYNDYERAVTAYVQAAKYTEFPSLIAHLIEQLGESFLKFEIRRLSKLLSNQEFERVIKTAGEVLKHVDDCRILMIVGAAQISLRQLQEAILTLRQVIHLKPNYSDAYNAVGIAYHELGEYMEAVNKFQIAINIDPTYAEAYNNIGNSYVKLNDTLQAGSSFEKAIELNPTYIPAYLNLGATYHRQGKLAAAVQNYRKALSMNGDDPHILTNLGLALSNMDKLDEAVELYVKAISLNPTSIDAKHNLLTLLKSNHIIKSSKHPIIDLDQEIKTKTDTLINKVQTKEVLAIIKKVMPKVGTDYLGLKSKQNQISCHSHSGLNCSRHFKFFNKFSRIAEFCFECYKVQIHVDTVIDLVNLTTVFLGLKGDLDLPRKCFIEMRDTVRGNYKGIIYCRGLEEANMVSNYLERYYKKTLSFVAAIETKRGCSEFAFEHPEFKNPPDKNKPFMEYPKEWSRFEEEFSKSISDIPVERKYVCKTLSLSDILVIRNWIDYAKGLADRTEDYFEEPAVVNEKVFEVAQKRRLAELET